MSDLIAHYAGSTGRLHGSVIYAEIVLRVALESKRMSPRRLRESMKLALDSLQRTLAEQKASDEALGWKEVKPREAA